MYEVFAPSFLCVWNSNAFEESTKCSVFTRFFAYSPSMGCQNL